LERKGGSERARERQCGRQSDQIGRRYDFKNIFAEKIGVFDSKQSYVIMQIFDHNIGL
jgi:hypothetical protein